MDTFIVILDVLDLRKISTLSNSPDEPRTPFSDVTTPTGVLPPEKRTSKSPLEDSGECGDLRKSSICHYN